METYYTKKEYNDMKRSFEKRIKALERQNQILSEKCKKLKKKDVAD
jgi:chaperonin cofactor prefoldin